MLALWCWPRHTKWQTIDRSWAAVPGDAKRTCMGLLLANNTPGRRVEPLRLRVDSQRLKVVNEGVGVPAQRPCIDGGAPTLEEEQLVKGLRAVQRGLRSTGAMGSFSSF